MQGCKPRLHAPEAPLSGHNDHRVVMSLTVLALALLIVILLVHLMLTGARLTRRY